MDPSPSAPSPSTCPESDRYVALKDQIYDGRYLSTAPCETRGPPIQLYHPVFGHLLNDIATDHEEVPVRLVQNTALLMSRVSGIYQNYAMWNSAIQPPLMDLLYAYEKENADFSPRKAHTMLVTDATMMDEVVCVGFVEDRNEFVEGGCNPSNEAMLSYVEFWAEPICSKIRQNSCCPSFLIAIDAASASIAIMGAVWRDKIIVQHLTDCLRFAHDAIFNEDTIYHNARIFNALAKNLHMLGAFYKSLQVKIHSPPVKELTPRFFPSINAYPRPGNTIVKFRYIVPFSANSACTTFLARIEGSDPQDIVVRFVCRYNEEAHQLLASKHMAPKLHYCGKVGFRPGDLSYGHLRMVVMDYVKGKTMDKRVILPREFPQRIEGILTVLHEADYVFGDLRGSNIMITKNGEVMFLDFGMVGKHSDSKYPMMMSPNVKWPKGVELGLGLMLKEHDLMMSEQLISSMIFHV